MLPNFSHLSDLFVSSRKVVGDCGMARDLSGAPLLLWIEEDVAKHGSTHRTTGEKYGVLQLLLKGYSIMFVYTLLFFRLDSVVLVGLACWHTTARSSCFFRCYFHLSICHYFVLKPVLCCWMQMNFPTAWKFIDSHTLVPEGNSMPLDIPSSVTIEV